MAMPTNPVKDLLDSRIHELDGYTHETLQEKQVFGATSDIISLVRDKMIDDKEFVKLSEYFFRICTQLKAEIRGSNTGDLSQSVVTGLYDLERSMLEIERTLNSGAIVPHEKRDKIEDQLLGIQRILGTLYAELNSPPGEVDSGRGEFVMSADPQDTVVTSASGNACRRLIRHDFAPPELPSLIDAILLSGDRDKVIQCLTVADAQVFVDVVEEGLRMPDLSPSFQKGWLTLLYRTCGHHGVIPGTFQVPVTEDRTEDPLFRGGYADVWKGEYNGRNVAVKVVRLYTSEVLQKLIHRFCKEAVMWRHLRHPNVLSLVGVVMSRNRFAMVSDWMVNGNINQYIRAHPDANKFGLLSGATKGLIYIHSNEMIHGDLKGLNVLIDETGRARIADFGLLTIVSDPNILVTSSSYTQGGTIRFMSPELIDPESFGFKSSRHTKSSDCYALGMVVYEAISGRPPFHERSNHAVHVPVMKGQHPTRGAGFPEHLWRKLESCWAFQPDDRPNVEDVLQCLETASDFPEPPSGLDEEMVVDSDDQGSRDVSPAIRPEISGIVTSERGPSASPGLNYVIESVSTPQPSTTPSSDAGLDSEDMDPGPSTRWDNISGGDIRKGPLSDVLPAQGTISLGEDMRMPQPPYVGGSEKNKGWVPKQSISFSTQGRPGVSFLDVANRELGKMDDKGDCPFDANCNSITIRMHFPGYASSTKVGNKLKQLRRKVTSMQIHTIYNTDGVGNPITKSMLVNRVSARVEGYINAIKDNSDLFRFDDQVGEQWRLGQGNMEFEHMIITELVNVSTGSWVPVIYIQ